MIQAQALLILGGLLNALAAMVVGFLMYWIQLRNPGARTTAGLVAFKVLLWNGFLLFGLAIAIEHTGFAAPVARALALSEVVVSVLAGARTLMIWAQKRGNIFRHAGFLARSVGLAHVVDLVVIGGIFYGVARTVLGI